MREIVSFSVLRTQTAPSPTAMLLGAVAASMKDAIRRPAGSMAATPFPIDDWPEGWSPGRHLKPCGHDLRGAATGPARRGCA
jgi:hypothetical protein